MPGDARARFPAVEPRFLLTEEGLDLVGRELNVPPLRFEQPDPSAYDDIIAKIAMSCNLDDPKRREWMNATHPKLTEAKYCESFDFNYDITTSEDELNIMEMQMLQGLQPFLDRFQHGADADNEPEESELDQTDQEKKRRERFKARMAQIIKTRDEKRKSFMQMIAGSATGWFSDKLIPLVADILTTLARFDKHLGRRRWKKFIVFSEYISALDIIEIALEQAVLPCLRYDGTKSIIERNQIRMIFEGEKGSEVEYRVLLASKQAISKDLTFSHCAAIFFVEPSWNPFVFDQAVGCALGPDNPNSVEVYTYKTKFSMDQKVHTVQKEKRARGSRLVGLDRLQHLAPQLEKGGAASVLDQVSTP